MAKQPKKKHDKPDRQPPRYNWLLVCAVVPFLYAAGDAVMGGDPNYWLVAIGLCVAGLFVTCFIWVNSAWSFYVKSAFVGVGSLNLLVSVRCLHKLYFLVLLHLRINRIHDYQHLLDLIKHAMIY